MRRGCWVSRSLNLSTCSWRSPGMGTFVRCVSGMESPGATCSRRSWARVGSVTSWCWGGCRARQRRTRCWFGRSMWRHSAVCWDRAASISCSPSPRTTRGRAARILEAVGIGDVEGLVDSIAESRRAPVSDAQLKAYLLRVADRRSPPQPGPVPPVFERYTAQARRAVRAAIETAALLEHRDVEPFHLLLGCLHVPESTAAQVMEAELAPSEMGVVGEAMERARMYGPPPAHQATGIFSELARALVAERALTLRLPCSPRSHLDRAPPPGDLGRRRPHGRADHRQRGDGDRAGSRSARPFAGGRPARR